MKHDEGNLSTLVWDKPSTQRSNGETVPRKRVALTMPTLDELLATDFRPRRHLLFPWLREQESVMLYADTGAGKSMFALSMALAVAGGGEYLGWAPEEKADGTPWRVLYVDGEMHAQDIQERAAMLLDAIPGIDRAAAVESIRFLPRQLQKPGSDFPCITDATGMDFVLRQVEGGKVDLLILDNFTTLGEVEDENAASSFNAIQDFLLRLKTTGVATVLVHHANKAGDNFRGSSKLAATFETIIHLARPEGHQETGGASFRVEWDKVRAGGPKRAVRPVRAKLATVPGKSFEEPERAAWEYETGDLETLEDLRERLKAGEFRSMAEASIHFGVSKQSLTRWGEKGIRLGLWTEDQLRHWIGKGRALRKRGRTEAPIRPEPGGDPWEEPLEGTSDDF